MSTLTLPRSNLASSAGSTAPRAAAIGRTDSAAAAAEADLRRFGANRHQEVDDLRVGVGTVRPWADADVVADGALRLVGRIAAASGWRNVPDGRVVHELLRGVPLTTACLQRAAGAEGAELLHEAGFVIAIGERWRLAFAVALVDDVFVLAPTACRSWRCTTLPPCR